MDTGKMRVIVQVGVLPGVITLLAWVTGLVRDPQAILVLVAADGVGLALALAIFWTV